MPLSESVIVITGAARGIGRAIAQRLNQAGVRLVASDVDADALGAAATDWAPGRFRLVVGDVADPAHHAALVAEALTAFRRLDAWVNNAGLARHRAIVDYAEAEIDRMLAVNLKGTILGSQAALRHLSAAGSGHIVNLVSTAALRGIPTESVYCAAKWGVRGFTQALAEEAAHFGVKVTAVLPGGVDTAFWQHAVDRDMPVDDFLRPDDVARAVVSLLEQDPHCVTREIVLRSIADRDFAMRPDKPIR